MNENQDISRRLLDLAVTCGRKHKSTQTGYLHYCYNEQGDAPHLSIPTVENFLFVLTLMKTRVADHVNEAKIMLEGLLHFQNLSDDTIGFGNFPIYLHEFPQCKERFNSVQIAITFYWILKLFHQVLGQQLKTRLEKAFTLLLKQCLRNHQEKPAPYQIAVKIAAAAKMGGALLNDIEIESQGSLLLKEIEHIKNPTAWYCPEAMGEILTGLAILHHSLKNSPWNDFWEHLQRTWHRQACCYVGPALKVGQRRSEPQVTVYDLFLSSFSDTLSSRILKETPIHLKAALIPYSDNKLSIPSYPINYKGTIEGSSWQLHHDRDIAYSLIEQGQLTFHSPQEREFHPLQIIWGDQERVHSFVCQGGSCKNMVFSAEDPTTISLTFTLNDKVEVEDRDKNREITFAIDAFPGMHFLVSGEKSSTFRLNEPVLLKSGNHSLEIVFERTEGEGRFIGHRNLGNRSSQVETKGELRFQAHDWLVFLRTISRSEHCLLTAKITIAENDEACI